MNPYYLRKVVEDLLRDEAGAFDPQRSCPYCLSEVDDAREVQLLRLDLQRFGYGDPRSRPRRKTAQFQRYHTADSGLASGEERTAAELVGIPARLWTGRSLGEP